jgi:nitrate reductase molybdenum cofactor assembly chaperone NarJ/NarW
MRITLRVLAALLAYPTDELRHELPAMRDALREEGALTLAQLNELEALIASLAAADPIDAQERYVATFDCARATSLHLFEHVHGDSRDRGPAMVDLASTYAQAGLALVPGELPDYLPVALEFASTQPPREARAFMAEIAHIVNAIHGALRERSNAYAAITAAVLELAGERVRAVPHAAEPSLDETWAEPAAFGPCLPASPAKPQPVHFVRRNAARGAAA